MRSVYWIETLRAAAGLDPGLSTASSYGSCGQAAVFSLNCKRALIFIATTLLLLTHNQLYAQNFIITPAAGYFFPTTIYHGSITSAYYTITNQTSTRRQGYLVQGVPTSVTQNASGPAYCSRPID